MNAGGNGELSLPIRKGSKIQINDEQSPRTIRRKQSSYDEGGGDWSNAAKNVK